MRSHQILFVVLVALCTLAAQDGVNGQALKKLFGMVSKAEANVPAEVEVLDDYDQKSAADAVDVETVDEPTDAANEASEERDTPVYTTTPRPGFFHQFSFPTLPPFTFPPFPAIPALPALPAIPPLPQLPSLPNLATIFPSIPPRQTIVATQTLLLEVTRRVTRVPICMSVIGNRPPCVVNDDTVQGGNDLYRSNSDSLWNDDIGEDGRIYIQPTAAYLYPEVMPTTTPLEGESREGKYLELKAARGEEKDVAAELESSVVQTHGAVAAGAGAGAGVAAFLRLGLPVTHIIKRTLYVTRVDTVTDYRVTATLVADNCVPNGVNIPYCPAKPPTPYPRTSTPRPQRYPTTQYTTPRTTYPTTRYTTPRTTYPTTRYTTPRTTYPTTNPTTWYTTRRTTSYPNYPYGAPEGAYPSNPPQSPADYEPVNTPSSYKEGEIAEQVDDADGIYGVLDNLTKA